MSSDVHFVLIRDFHHKRKLDEVMEWLEENVVLGHGEAQRVDQSLPFEIPMGFPSREEAKDFVAKLELLGCVIAIESLSERKARAAKAAEQSAESEIEEAAKAPPPKPNKKEKAASAQDAKNSDKEVAAEEEKNGKPPWMLPVAVAAGVVVLVLVGWLSMDKVDTKAVSEWSEKVDMNIISFLQQESESGSPFSQVVGNMQRHIDEQNYSQEQRQEHSTTYLGEVQGEKPVKNREARKRNIILIQASIGFYRKNGKAWKRLVAEYAAIGATLKVEEIRKEMVEIFGEEETAELLTEFEEN